MRTDPVTLQILRNHLRAAAESMATTLYRTAHSTFVKETEDFTIQVLDAGGKTCAVPIDIGASQPGAIMGPAALRTAGIVESLPELGHEVVKDTLNVLLKYEADIEATMPQVSTFIAKTSRQGVFG